ncbi:MAG: GNAT family N-acetyltransferase [Clostridiaceae bacterium]|nr:GNAT family N-acetyltransferase [Clostridiaceae bacterium]
MTLETDRLILRSWQETDAEALYKYASHPDLGPIAGWLPHTSPENSKEIIRDMLSAPLTFAVVLKESTLPIGSISLMTGDATDLTDLDNECELGYWLGRPYWGQGLIPEAAKRLIRYGFDVLNMQKIWSAYYDGNEKSKRVQGKCGFSYHHTAENIVVPLMGEIRTGHVNCLSQDEWKKKVFTNE